MLGPVRAVVQVGLAVAEMVRAKAADAADAVLRQGSALVSTPVAGQVGAFGEEVLAAARANRATLTSVVREEVEKAVDGALSGSAGDLERARVALRQLTADLDELRAQVASVPLLGSAAAAGVAGLSQATGLAERAVGRGRRHEADTTERGGDLPGEVMAPPETSAPVRRLDPGEVLRTRVPGEARAARPARRPAAPPLDPQKGTRTGTSSPDGVSGQVVRKTTTRAATPQSATKSTSKSMTKKAATKAAAGGGAASKATAKKAPATGSTAKRAAVKQATAKRATAKKANARKVTATKATASKATTKRATAKTATTKSTASSRGTTTGVRTPVRRTGAASRAPRGAATTGADSASGTSD